MRCAYCRAKLGMDSGSDLNHVDLFPYSHEALHFRQQEGGSSKQLRTSGQAVWLAFLGLKKK